MIKNSQIEKFTESGVPARPLTSGKAATPKALPGKYGKNYLLRGKQVEFTFTASCGKKTEENDIGRSCTEVGPATNNSQPKGITAWWQRRNPQGQQ
jgi:hypothetical protein